MRQAIEAEAQNLPSQMFSNFISRLVSSGINLLNFDLKDTRNRIVGLVVLDCLLDISDEIMPERRVEIANQLRKVLENEKQNIETTGDVIRKAAGWFERSASLDDYRISEESREYSKILFDLIKEAKEYNDKIVDQYIDKQDQFQDL